MGSGKCRTRRTRSDHCGTNLSWSYAGRRCRPNGNHAIRGGAPGEQFDARKVAFRTYVDPLRPSLGQARSDLFCLISAGLSVLHHRWRPMAFPASDEPAILSLISAGLSVLHHRWRPMAFPASDEPAILSLISAGLSVLHHRWRPMAFPASDEPAILSLISAGLSVLHHRWRPMAFPASDEPAILTKLLSSPLRRSIGLLERLSESHRYRIAKFPKKNASERKPCGPRWATLSYLVSASSRHSDGKKGSSPVKNEPCKFRRTGTTASDQALKLRLDVPRRPLISFCGTSRLPLR